MNDINLRIETAKVKLRKAETEKTKAETQLETANNDREKIVADMAAHGVTPDTIDAKITELEQQIAKDLATVESIIPEVQ